MLKVLSPLTICGTDPAQEVLGESQFSHWDYTGRGSSLPGTSCVTLSFSVPVRCQFYCEHHECVQRDASLRGLFCKRALDETTEFGEFIRSPLPSPLLVKYLLTSSFPRGRETDLALGISCTKQRSSPPREVISSPVACRVRGALLGAGVSPIDLQGLHSLCFGFRGGTLPLTPSTWKLAAEPELLSEVVSYWWRETDPSLGNCIPPWDTCLNSCDELPFLRFSLYSPRLERQQSSLDRKADKRKGDSVRRRPLWQQRASDSGRQNFVPILNSFKQLGRPR